MNSTSNPSQLELAKNKNIQARFETKETGKARSKLYRVTLTDGVVANVIFNDGEDLEQAKACMANHYGKRLQSVEASSKN